MLTLGFSEGLLVARKLLLSLIGCCFLWACKEQDCGIEWSCPRCEIMKCCPRSFDLCTYSASDEYRSSSPFTLDLREHCGCPGTEPDGSVVEAEDGVTAGGEAEALDVELKDYH